MMFRALSLLQAVLYCKPQTDRNGIENIFLPTGFFSDPKDEDT